MVGQKLNYGETKAVHSYGRRKCGGAGLKCGVGVQWALKVGKGELPNFEFGPTAAP